MKNSAKRTAPAAKEELPVPGALAKQYEQMERDPILRRFNMVKKSSGLSDAYISRVSGISTSCLRSWGPDGKTRRPMFSTMQFALRACGFDFEIVKKDK